MFSHAKVIVIGVIKLAKFVAIILEKLSVLIVLPNDQNKLYSNLHEDKSYIRCY